MSAEYYREEAGNLLKYKLAPLLKKYLKMPSLDGRTERQELRKQLLDLMEQNDKLQESADKLTDW